MACCFTTEDHGHRRGIEPRAEVGIYVVYADDVVPDEDFAFFQLRDGDVGLVLQHFRAAGFLDEDAFHGFGEAGAGSHCVVGGAWIAEVGGEEGESLGGGGSDGT